MPQRTSKIARSQSASASAAPDEGDASLAGVSRRDESPVRADELDALFASLLSYRSLVLAVSGGADSMALMHLVRGWADGRTDAPQIIFATVDHGLRAESREEAAWVVAEARALGFEAHVLTWEDVKPTTGIQEAARGARYRLLADLAASIPTGPVAIVTAHTEDDQAETLLMRLARGSGLDGLAGMPTERLTDATLHQAVLARPLLGTSGARLRATLREAGRTWIEDPSNEAEQFERVRVRKAVAVLGLESDKLALSARRLARAKEALDACVDDLARAAKLDLNGGMFATFDAAPWAAAPEELRLRLLSRLISSFGGQEEPVNLARLEALVGRMPDATFEGATLGGAVVARHGSTLRVYREAGRGAFPTLVLAPGETAIWDRRFRVASAASAPDSVEVRALGPQGYAELRRQLEIKSALPAAAAATLPGFWRKDQLMSVPWFSEVPQADGLWNGDRTLFSAEFLG